MTETWKPPVSGFRSCPSLPFFIANDSFLSWTYEKYNSEELVRPVVFLKVLLIPMTFESKQFGQSGLHLVQGSSAEKEATK